jgi:hypothetical protein
MAASKRPSFLKRQKEQQRAARALEKREAKRARKQAKLTGGPDVEGPEPLDQETDESEGTGVGADSEEQDPPGL